MTFEDAVLLAFNVVPSDLPSFYWTKTLEDLQRITGLHIRLKMVTAMSITESFMYTAGQIFGTKETGVREITSVSDLMSLADMVNNAA